MEINWKDLAEKFDAFRMIKWLESFPVQLAEAERLGAAVDLSQIQANPRHVLFVGMGGSAMAGDILRLLYRNSQAVPMMVLRDYRVPAWVAQEDLVVALSYSGNTEETQQAIQEAQKRGSSLLAITSGGKLAKFCQLEQIPWIQIPAGRPPRTALGYLLIPLLLVFSRLGFIAPLQPALMELQAISKQSVKAYRLHLEEKSNPAKQLAKSLWKKLPIFYASQSMEAVALRWKAQFNENAKQHAFWNVLPEMNHNEIVGWHLKGQEDIRKLLQPVLLLDSEELPQIRRRMALTNQMLQEEGFQVLRLEAQGRSQLARFFSLILWADFTSYYLALLNQVDPTPIPVIEDFKDRLQEKS